MQTNYKILTTGVLILAIGIILLLFRWQVLEHDKWSIIAQSQYISDQRAPTSRGVIYSEDGTVLAIDEPAWGVYASLSNRENERKLFFESKDRFAAEVAGILEIDKNHLKEKLTKDFRYVNIAHGVSEKKVRALQEAEIFTKEELRRANLPITYQHGFGLYFEKEEKRVYPDGVLASHILGFMGKNKYGENIGRYGIEGYYFSDMKSEETISQEEKDSQGNIILTVEYDPIKPREGKSITLTIQTGLQSKVEKQLQESVEKHKAKSGSVIIMEPSTGKILAMANYPNYDPNKYWKTTNPEIFKNKTVTDPYEPGSIQKPISMAIGLESGRVPEDWICNDEKGYLEIYEEKFWTWDKEPDGKLTLSGILENSNNPCIAQVALMMDFEYYHKKLKEFGYGSYIGVGLQEESQSYMLPYNKWTKVDFAASSFGQALSVTPLQMITSLNIIANDGKRMQPYIVSEIKNNEEIIKYKPVQISQPISTETSNKVTEMLVNTAEQGGIELAFHNYLNDYTDYKIAGKTGTAQIAKRYSAGYYENKTNVSFIGYAPAYNPKMIMIVKLEEPQSSPLAVNTAVPTWSEIFNVIATDLGIEKEK